ncbi:sulfurtransferase/chromate resistance protein [Rhizobium sp. 0TCS1.26]|uniref:chromate resistance protein ChrB domain-containing protein n=1 Tax=Rhizobium sp. 0TCS1.26 TaxID=3142623 RepID=UPI003D286820
MASFNSISPDKTARILGSPRSPAILDVRFAADVAAFPFVVPGSVIRDYATVGEWAPSYRDAQSVIVVCKRGKKLSEGVAAHLRCLGIEAEVLEGGTEAWQQAGLPLVPMAAIPDARPGGSTLWVTRSRPKIDRIACPWLIRRFIDPDATFLFVSPSEINAVAEHFGATPFDVEGAFWSHRGEFCTFDTMLEEFRLTTEPLLKMATIVRAADTDRLDQVPQAAGLLAISLGLSRLYSKDLEQLDAGMVIYDSLYRWARDATEERHDWVAHAPKRATQ